MVALAVVIVGSIISLVFGVKYLRSCGLIQVMLGAIVISMLGFPQVITVMAGKQRAFLVTNHRLNQPSYCISYFIILLACWGLHLLTSVRPMSGCSAPR